MQEKNRLLIGLFGFGVVGEGIYRILENTPALDATIQTICIKQPSKQRSVDPALLTTDYDRILEDEAIQVVIELIDDAGEALAIVRRALAKKKAVVSANKKMVAENLEELLQLQREHGVPLLYEAAVCGSIPVIRNLEEYYDNDLLQGICGIVNGSTNFILTKMFEDGIDYSKALSLAQQFGYAESDPALDVEGVDAVNKLTILLLHGYGIVSKPQDHLRLGITRLHSKDAVAGAQKGWQVKLTAQLKKLRNGGIAAFVLPQFVGAESQLYTVQNEYNGVVLQSSFADKQFLYGKGAGRYPTAGAVLSDLSALRYRYQYEYRKLQAASGVVLTTDFYLRVYVSFDSWSDVAQADFEWIEEFYCQDDRQYLIGVLHFERLNNAAWLYKTRVSVILCPDGIVEEVDYRRIREQSLALAGSRYEDRTKESLQQLTGEAQIIRQVVLPSRPGES